MAEENLEYDRLDVSVKAEKAEELKKAYRAFGWELKDEREDDRYGDLVCMNFIRPHLIKSKDRLQLLQVRFEVALNFIGRAQKRIPARAVSAGVLLALAGLALACYGGYALYAAASSVFLACGAALVSAGAVFIVLAVLCGRRLYIKDTEKYTAIIMVLTDNMKTIISEASHIIGDEYETE